MPPKKHYAKSQEFVYKSVGQGSRQKYKLVATDIPRNVAASTHTAGQESLPATLPPVVSSPLDAEGPDHLLDPMYFDNINEIKPKKSGKVSPNFAVQAIDELIKSTPASEAIRLHEDLVGGETGKIPEQNHRHGSWTTGSRSLMFLVPNWTGGMAVPGLCGQNSGLRAVLQECSHKRYLSPD